MFNGKKSIFDRVNSCLMKKGHELIMSIYLCNYNGNEIYIRFDYVRKISAYKISWVDFNFFDNKKIITPEINAPKNAKNEIGCKNLKIKLNCSAPVRPMVEKIKKIASSSKKETDELANNLLNIYLTISRAPFCNA